MGQGRGDLSVGVRLVSGLVCLLPSLPLHGETMRATVRVNTHLVLDLQEVPSGMVDQLRGHLTVPNPEREAAQKAGRSVEDVPALVQVYEVDGWDFRMPRGAVHLVKQVAQSHGVALRWVSEVVSRSVRRVPLDHLGLNKDYQRRQSPCPWGPRVCRAPCRRKTVIGASAGPLREPGIVLVHTHDLLRQWVDLFRSWEVPVRSLSGEDRDLEPLRMRHGDPEVLVGTVQSLHRLGDRAAPLLQSCGAVILDEAHHAPAGTFRDVLQNIPARYRWGLTATPHRADGWDVLLPLVLGPERWSTSMAELVDLGHLLLPDVYSLDSQVSLDSTKWIHRGRVNMARAVNALCAHPGRTELLTEVVHHLALDGRTILVLVPRVQYAQDLADRFRGLRITAMLLTGSTGSVSSVRSDQSGGICPGDGGDGWQMRDWTCPAWMRLW